MAPEPRSDQVAGDGKAARAAFAAAANGKISPVCVLACALFADLAACSRGDESSEIKHCAATGDCEDGATCSGGICRADCAGPAGAPCMTGVCREFYSAGQILPGEFFCSHRCDPVHPALEDARFMACGLGGYCLATLSKIETSTCVVSRGANVIGNACSAQSECTNGLACADGKCTPWCRTAADCPVPYAECDSTTFDRFADVNDHVGYCRL